MIKAIIGTIFGAILFLSSPAMAWGDLGHEVICEIAFQELDAAPRGKIKALMQLDPEFRLFSKSCTWPDHPRIRSREHYVNLSRAMTQIGDDPCPVASKCVVSAILNDMRDLAIRGDDQELLRLLKSLGHWVGDVHQPVHVSFADDRGANKIDVDSPCDTNLHSVWDTCIIKKTMGEDAKTLAIDLRAEISEQDRSEWSTTNVTKAVVIGWANESFAIAVKPDVEYCVQKNGECWYTETEREFTGGQEKDANANQDYLDRHSDTVRMRMKQAAVRLASILNVVFAQ